MEGKLEKTTGDKEKLAPVSGATAALCIEKSPILALIFHKLFKTQNVGISAFQLPPLTTISPLGFRKTMMAQRTFVHQEQDNTSLPCENLSWHSGANTFDKIPGECTNPTSKTFRNPYCTCKHIKYIFKIIMKYFSET